jgi:hypothetical protein
VNVVGLRNKQRKGFDELAAFPKDSGQKTLSFTEVEAAAISLMVSNTSRDCSLPPKGKSGSQLGYQIGFQISECTFLLRRANEEAQRASEEQRDWYREFKKKVVSFCELRKRQDEEEEVRSLQERRVSPHLQSCLMFLHLQSTETKLF